MALPLNVDPTESTIPLNVDRQGLRAAADFEIANSSQFNRGWQSADLGEDANSLLWKARNAYANGDDAGGAVLEQQGRDIMQRSQQWAPTVQNLTDVTGLRSGADWVGGALGNIRSSLKPALGGLVGAGLGAAAAPFTGGVINPLVGARAGAFLTGYDQMTEAAGAQAMMDEQIRKNRTMAEIGNTSRMAGAVQGALESVVPAGLAGSVAGLTGREAAKQIAKDGLKKTVGKRVLVDGGEEFATEFLQNPVGDVAQNQLKGAPLDDIDWKAAFNAGAAGFVGGAGMGAAGAAADAGYSKLGQGAEAVKEFAKKPLSDKIADGLPVILDKVLPNKEFKDGDNLERGLDATLEAVKRGEFRNFTKLTDDDAALGAGPEADTELLNRVTSRAQKHAERVIANPGDYSQRERQAAASFVAHQSFEQFDKELKDASDKDALDSLSTEIDSKAPKQSLMGMTSNVTIPEHSPLNILSDSQQKKVFKLVGLGDIALKSKLGELGLSFNQAKEMRDEATALQQAQKQSTHSHNLTEDGETASQLTDLWLDQHGKDYGAFARQKGTPEAKRAALSLMAWVNSGFGAEFSEDKAQTFLPKALDHFAEDAPEIVKSMVTLAVRQGTLKDAKQVARVLKEVKQRVDDDTGDHTFVKEKLTPLEHREGADEKTRLLVTHLRKKQGLVSDKERKLIAKYVGEHNLAAVINHFRPKVKESTEVYGKDGNFDEDLAEMTPEERSYEEEQSAQAAERIAEGRRYVGQSKTNEYFDTDNAIHKNQFERMAKEQTAAKGADDAVARSSVRVGIIDRELEKAAEADGTTVDEMSDAAKNKVIAAIVHKHHPELVKVTKSVKGESALAQKDHAERRAAYEKKLAQHARALNKRYQTMRIEESEGAAPGINFSEADLRPVEQGGIRLDYDLRDPYTAKNVKNNGILNPRLSPEEGRIVLERHGKPFVTSTQMLMAKMFNVRDNTTESTKDYKGTAQMAMQRVLDAIASIQQHEGFSGKLAVVRKGKMVEVKDLPNDLRLWRSKDGVSHYVGTAKGQAVLQSENDKSFDYDPDDKAAVTGMLSPKELHFRLLDLAWQKTENDVFVLGEKAREAIFEAHRQFKAGNATQSEELIAQYFPKGRNSTDTVKRDYQAAKDTVEEMQVGTDTLADYDPDKEIRRDDANGMAATEDATMKAGLLVGRSTSGTKPAPATRAVGDKIKDKRIASNVENAEPAEDPASKALEVQKAKATSQALALDRLENAKDRTVQFLRNSVDTLLDEISFMNRAQLKLVSTALFGADQRSVHAHRVNDTVTNSTGAQQRVYDKDLGGVRTKPSGDTSLYGTVAVGLSELSAEKLGALYFDKNTNKARIFVGRLKNAEVRIKSKIAETHSSLDSNGQNPKKRNAKATDVEGVGNSSLDTRGQADTGESKTGVVENAAGNEDSLDAHYASMAKKNAVDPSTLPPATPVWALYKQDGADDTGPAVAVYKDMATALREAERNGLVAVNDLAKNVRTKDSKTYAKGDTFVTPLRDGTSFETRVAAVIEFAGHQFLVHKALSGKGYSATEPSTGLRVTPDPEHLGRVQTISGTVEHIGAKLRAIGEKSVRNAVEKALRTKDSTMKPGGKASTQEERDAAKAAVLKIIGNKIKVEFDNKMKGAGSWTPQQTMNLIKLAINGDVIGAAFHESFHEIVDIMRQNGGDNAVAVIERAAMNPLMQTRLRQKLEGHPKAQAQLATPEEAAAFMFQMWMADPKGFALGSETKSVFTRIKDMLRSVAGIVSESVRKANAERKKAGMEALKVEELLHHFADGALANADTRKAVVAALNKDVTKHDAAVEKVGAAWTTLANSAGKLVFSAEAMMDATGNKHMVEIARMFHQKAGTAMQKVGKAFGGYSDGVRQQTSYWLNKGENILIKHDKGDIELARQHLSKETKSSDPKVQAIVDELRGFMDEMKKYIADKDVRVFDDEAIDPDTNTKGAWKEIHFRKDYWPQVVDMKYLGDHMQEFKDDLLTHHMDALEALARKANQEVKNGEDAGENSASEQMGAKKPAERVEITPEHIAEAIATRLMNSMGTVDMNEDSSDLGMTPAARAVNRRSLDWLNKDVFDKYMSKDVTNIVTTYAHSVVKRAEYQSRFGYGGDVIKELSHKAVLHELGGDELIDKAEKVLPLRITAWKKAQAEAHAKGIKRDVPFPTLRSVGQSIHKAKVVAKEVAAGKSSAEADAEYTSQLTAAVGKLEQGMRAVQAMEGTLGNDISAGARAVGSWLVTYQNFRLLSTMLFMSFQDVMGLVREGGEMGDAWKAFTSGISEIKNTWSKTKTPSQMMERSEMWGAVDAGSFAEAVAQSHGSIYMTGKAKEMSDKFFKYTGAEGWNRGVRAVAANVAERIITEWKTEGVDSTDKAVMARVERLFGKGFDVANIKLDAKGQLDIHDPLNQAAITRWMLDAVPAPTAAHRPIWGSDPHFQAFMHLKNYTYTFHRIALKGAVAQAKLGNYRPAAVLAVGYVPIAIAAGAVKEMLIPGEEPPWMQGGLDDYLSYGFARAGLLGVPQMYSESLFDPAALFGPSVDQAQNILSVPFMEAHSTVGEGLGSLPGGNLLKRLERLGE